VTAPPDQRWRIAPGQRLSFEDLDDGIVLFDAKTGATHLLDASAAETLAVVEEAPGLDCAAIRERLLERLALAPDALPLPEVASLLQRFEWLNLLRAEPP
jgi:PqqD family protein of HPr-rel-A system